MPDPIPPTPPNPSDTPTPKLRGYLDQAQLDVLGPAAGVLTAAQDHADDLTARQITADDVAGFATAFTQALSKTRSSAIQH